MNKLRKQSNTTYPLFFLMVDSTDHVTGKTGLSPTVTISKNGGSFASPSGAVSEVGNGLYKVAGNATDSNTLGELWIHATGTGADPTDTAYTVVPYDPFDAVRLGLTALPNAAAEAAGGLYTRGSGAGQINQPANGQIDANTVKVSGTTQTARDIGASVLLSSGTGTGQLDFTSGVVKSNMTQIDGLATSGNNATLNLKQLSVVNSNGDALVLTSSGSNGRGANITGHGTSEGVLVTGGGTGVKFKGGSTLGNHGLVCQSSSAGGSGILASGTGSYAGISAYNTTAPTGGGPGVSIQSYDASGSVGGLEIYSIGGRSVVLGEGASPITGSIEGNINGNLSGSVGSLDTQAKSDVNAEVKDVLETDTQAEPTSPPASTASLRDKIAWIFTLWKNKRTSTSALETVLADDGVTPIATSTKSDVGGTYTKGKFQ